MNSEQVPHNFADWLLSMGCPSEKIPSLDKLKQMCRGDYYMVWRHLIERVQSKQVIREKRLQVFLYDVKKYQKGKATLKESIYMPEELAVWTEHRELNRKLDIIKSKVDQNRQEMNELMIKVSSKISQRGAVERRVQDTRRRAWLLERACEELRSKRENLQETRAIARAFQQNDHITDIPIKIEKCISLLSRQYSQNPNPSNSMSIVSTTSDASDNDMDEQLLSLVSVPGSALWSQLYERRAALVEKLSACNTHMSPSINTTSGVTRLTQSVLAHSAALHSVLALDYVKNQNQINHLRERLAITLNQFHSAMSEEERELLILRCERAKAEARVGALRGKLGELAAGTGVFRAEGEPCVETGGGALRQIANIDRSMEAKASELRRLKTSLVKTERRIQNVKDSLQSIFSGFQKHIYALENGDAQNDEPLNVIVSTRQFYEQRRRKSRNEMELSLDLDVTESSFFDGKDNAEPTFTDELKIYLRSFNLENNRKLVLDSGETLWIFETLEQSARRLQARIQEDARPTYLCPALTAAMNVTQLSGHVTLYRDLKAFVDKLKINRDRKCNEDITLITAEGEVRNDKIKKVLQANILHLQKIVKTIEIGEENLKLWSENKLRLYVSDKRTVDGKKYKQYESIFLGEFEK